MLQAYEWFLWGMAALAVVVFVALYHVKAGYGLLRDGRWGPKIGNRLGWFLMESPVFIAMCLFWFCSSRRFEATPLVFFGLFQLHYLNRAFIYPLLLKGQSKMPLGIIVMGVVFNLLNACMQGCWIFYLAPEGMYTSQWLLSPQFIAGASLFFLGMGINIHSDPDYPTFASAWRYGPLPAAGRDVPLRVVGQLFRGNHRVDRFCRADLVCRRCGVRTVDLRESGTPCRCHLPSLWRDVRR